MEQGYKDRAYVAELCDAFKDWTFDQEPYASMAKTGPRVGPFKSDAFRTFAHPAFDFLWDRFRVSGQKTDVPGTIAQCLEPLGLCSWVADDGSLHQKSNDFIGHTQRFADEEILAMCQAFHDTFGLHAKVKPHQDHSWVTYLPAKDASVLHT